MALSQTEFFHRLGAPLSNPNWSWGAVSPEGVVFVRAWQDETRRVDGSLFTRLTNHAHFADANGSNPGYNERLRHVQQLQDGSPGYVVMCVAKNVKASPRAIQSFDERDLHKIGAIRDIDGDQWAKLEGRVSVRNLLGR